jgi:uncharacterized membrane protein YfbV (UPF0208 family)
MEANIVNSIGLFALGFVPTLAALELSWKMAYRLGKKDAAAAAASTAGTTKHSIIVENRRE